MNDKNNYFSINDNMFFLKGPNEERFHLTTPSIIVLTNVFKTLMDFATKNLRKKGIETGLSMSWFRSGISQKYDTVVYVKNDIINNFPMNIPKIYNYANFLIRGNSKQQDTRSIRKTAGGNCRF